MSVSTPITPTSDGGDAGDPAGGGRSRVAEVVRNLVRHSTVGATNGTNEIRDLVEDWLGCDPVQLPGYSDSYWEFMHVNLQAALDVFLAEPGRESRIVGVHAPSATDFEEVPFSRLLAPPSLKWSGASTGLVDSHLRPCGPNERMRCLERAVVLFRDADGAGAIWLAHRGFGDSPVTIEVLTSPGERAPRLIEDLRALSEKHSPYKGKMFRLRVEYGVPIPDFMTRPAPMGTDDIILPDGLIERIEQHTIAVSRSREKLKRLGLHLKRGILLHGPPGTGKTHTLRYLASNMPESTFAIIPKQAIKVAPILLPIIEPAVIVLDDVDLVAENRTLPGLTSRRALFDVLETLDGINDGGDVLFVLTTNRIDTMEPAIASRPGRVDQSIELPRPDADCRRRLFQLYSRGLDFDAVDEVADIVVERTGGVTASFFKELMRRAAVKAVAAGAVDAGGRATVSGELVLTSLDDMLDPANPMTRMLLGATREEAAREAAAARAGGAR